MYSRRDFGKLALAGLPLSIASAQSASEHWINSVIGGVQIGAQSYSFRDLPFDEMVAAFAKVGLGECELWQGNIEPRRVPREELRKWRLETPLDHFQAMKLTFDHAGVKLFAYNYSFRDDFTDEEIDRGFQMCKALGCGLITASSTVSVAPRVIPFAERHEIPVAFHGHSNTKDPNEFATPESFGKAMEMSDLFLINLDIGHFRASNYDPVDYIREHHAKIPVVHLKDRRRDDGPNTPWGEGDTPIKEVLRLIQSEKYPIVANIEYEYRGKDNSIAEVTKCFEYCKEALT